ncbi:MAG: hypothetical protein H3C31_12050 [Brumimicrobium sp.]|nr:hypothetical protein [Brumimicrobium sp.]
MNRQDKILIKLTILLAFSLGMVFTNASYGAMRDDQENPNINQKDEQGRKQGKWVFLGKDQPEKGYPADGKISEGPFKDDRKNGRWYMYYNDGVTVKTEGEYIDNRPNGAFIKYHPNGKVKEEGTFNSRNYTNDLKRFNEEGTLVYSSSFDDAGNEEGAVKYFYDNGQVEFEYEAKDGKPTGTATRYWPNGDVKEKLTFNSDGSLKETSGEIAMVKPKVEVKEVGKVADKLPPKPVIKDPKFKPNAYNKVYNDNLELWMEGDFKDGRLFDGRLYIYDSDGLLLKVEVYKKGKYFSDGQI